jgi:Protein of unknown function (DUF4232)
MRSLRATILPIRATSGQNRRRPAAIALSIASASWVVAACGAPSQWAVKAQHGNQTTIVSPKTAPTAKGSAQMEFAQCQSSILRLADAPVSEKTEQHSVLLTITNDGTASCSLLGYPGIALYDGNGELLALTYEPKGDQMVTSSPPQAVNLPIGATGYVLINKNVCVGPEAASASALHFIAPSDTTSLILNLSIGGLTSCESRADPGSTLDISPVEPTASATYAPLS